MVISLCIRPIPLYQLGVVTDIVLNYCKICTTGSITFTSLHYLLASETVSVILDAPGDTSLPFLYAYIQNHAPPGGFQSVDIYGYNGYTPLSEAL